MLFNSLAFAAFFSVFALLWRFAFRDPAQRVWLLAVSSLLFYAGFDYRFVPLLCGTALMDFAIARVIERQSDRGRKLRFLWLSVTLNVGVLIYFKYTNFFIGAAFGFFRHAGLIDVDAPVFDIILPVGISFYTFQSMSYVIDVYRGEIKARANPLTFISAISFFPHLVAGPIIRSASLISQFESPRSASWEEVQEAVLMIGAGLLKKSMADWFGVAADRLFQGAGPVQTLDAWTGTLAFAGQVYGDFSGYTDIAIGIALLLGVRLPKNFDKPYLATSPADFWRRWHISLGTWINEYLYLPLAFLFNRRGFGGTRLALFLSMVIIGLWHGASWNFLVYGIYHGAIILGALWVSQKLLRLEAKAGPIASRAFKVASTYYLILIGMVLFRARDLPHAAEIVREMHSRHAQAGRLFDSNALPLVLSGLALCYLVGYFGDSFDRIRRHELLTWAAAGAFVAWALALGGTGQAFIYFQF